MSQNLNAKPPNLVFDSPLPDINEMIDQIIDNPQSELDHKINVIRNDPSQVSRVMALMCAKRCQLVDIE